ncbi:MAG: hypothetical protein IPJ41_17645 [Phycisphaerales bacterium]|nr:hypothetical protein [Phycisphaerales bacterium]
MIVAASVCTAAVAVLAFPLVIAGLPEDYFAARRRPPARFVRAHPALRWTFRIAKNVLGAALLVLGVALLALPGQGLLTIVAGLILVEFPGKRRLELAIARRERVMLAMNWIRRKARKPALQRPPR